MEIHVLGEEGDVCRSLEQNARRAAAALNLDCRFSTVHDPHEIMTFGVTVTPALVVDNELRTMGRVPEVEEIISLLEMLRDD